MQLCHLYLEYHTANLPGQLYLKDQLQSQPKQYHGIETNMDKLKIEMSKVCEKYQPVCCTAEILDTQIKATQKILMVEDIW